MTTSTAVVSTTDPAITPSLRQIATAHLETAIAEATAFLDAAHQVDHKDDDGLIAWYTLPGHTRDVPLTMTTVRALTAAPEWLPTITFLDAAQCADTQGNTAVAEWIRGYAAGCRCGDPQHCVACGTTVCATCNVGEPSGCDHDRTEGVLCVGCDIECCPECRREFCEERTAEAARGGWFA